MAKVECDVEYDDIENDSGNLVPGVVVSCTECEHAEEAYGQTAKSVRRCLALLRENCPEGQENYYVASGGEDEG